jgi:hypothetical protein
METKFVEIPISEARPGDWAVLKANSWPSEVRAEVYKSDGFLAAAGLVVRVVNGSAGPAVVRVERAVPALPTKPGSIIRANASDGTTCTIREVMFLDVNGHWYDSSSYSWLPHEIDPSSVEIGRVVFDGEVSE